MIDRKPDVEAVFEFNGTKTKPIISGYQPAHLITENYLTTGVHHYYKAGWISPTSTVKGTITFISPEAYPHCLWIGKKIQIREGQHIVGHATIVKIFNSLLHHDNNADDSDN